MAATILLQVIGQHYVMPTEKHLASKDGVEVLKKMCIEANLGGPEVITYDAEFRCSGIAIGEKEVEKETRLRNDLQLTLQPPEKTTADMGKENS